MLTVLLTACREEEPSAADAVHAVRFSVTEEPWQNEQVSVTRAGETMTALKASGFGLYCGELSLDNVQTTWDGTHDCWQLDGRYLWTQGLANASFYALAPYNTPFASLNSGTETITIPAFNSDPPDLLYATHKNVARGETVQLCFHHALAKLTMGTVTIDPTIATSVTDIKLAATLYNAGTLSLADGVNYGKFTARSGDVAISNIAFSVGTSILMIPREDVTVTLTLTCTPASTFTVTKTLTLESGKNHILNVKIGKNHEVVIQ